MICPSPQSPLPVRETFDSTSEGEGPIPCVVHLLSMSQAERQLRDFDARLIELTEELALSNSQDDADLIVGEINHFQGHRERLQARVEELKRLDSRKRHYCEPDAPTQVAAEEEEVIYNSQGLTRSKKALLATATAVSAPIRCEWWMELYHDFFNLWQLQPPTTTGRVLNPRPFYENTEDIGQYLIQRGFPIIGDGSHSITFLISDRWVAKVARYGWHTKQNQHTLKHFQERNLDLAMYSAYPKVFAQSRLVFVSGDKEGITYRLYLQERLYGPFIYGGLDTNDINASPFNRASIAETLDKETNLKQWAWTSERGQRNRMLKCFDYQ